MLAYCVYRSSSLKARLLSEQFDGNESKIQKPPHHRARSRANFSAYDLVITKDEWRFLIEVSLKKLNSTAIWAFVLFYSLSLLLLVFLYRNYCRYVFVERCYNIWSLQKKPTARAIIRCLHSSSTDPWTDTKTVLLRHDFMSWISHEFV